MDVDGFLESLRRDPNYADQIVHAHTEPAREPVWAPLPEGLHPDVQKFLSAQGVSRVYQHQAEAIAASLRGEDVILTTGPASGKSLCYQVPILQSMLCEAETTALLLFPMKALARDQMGAWNRGVAAIPTLAKRKDVRAAAFDADASGADKRAARGSARFLATNPEMLHVRLLPAHGRWGRFYQGLRYIVIDEIHTYAGFFGANMANVLRRLARVCEHYGSRPQFICSSATVGNPVDVAQRVTGRTLHHVGRDTSASGARTYVFWNPPRIKKGAWRARRSANVEAHDLMVQLVKQRVPTLCFSKSRTSAELVYRYVRETLQTEAPVLADRVAAYRGGYSPAERRDMERRLREGELLGVSCTRALELGIDVGALDACIVVGYPGWLHAFYQQMGRAGRCGRASLCVLVGTGTVINQYVMQHPEYVFERPMERAVVDCDNPFVVLGHVRCATAELPLHDAETAAFGYCADLALDVLEEKHKVFHGADAWYHASPDPPAHEVRLRGYGDESTVIMDVESKEVLDRLDKFRAVRIFYPGAVYFHRGDTWLMVHHDFERNVVWVRREDVPYYTDPISGTCVNHVDRVLDQRPLGTGTAHLGEVFAVLSTFVYERVRFYSLERLSQHPADVPDFSYEAMSFWLTTPPELPLQVAKIGLNPEDGMRGILYCTSRILPLFLTSDINDFDWSLGCRNAPWHTMFWFEFYLRGIGNSEQCYERMEEILSVTLEHLLRCDCEDGCPNCTSRLITPYHVRNVELGEGQVHSRRAAVVVLNSLLTGQSVKKSAALLDAPRKRGMQLLPALTSEYQQAQPHTMPLDERTRRLMLRKIERMRMPTLPVDHRIELTPPVGIPALEGEETAEETDASQRAGHAAIRRGGDPIARKLLRGLKKKPKKEPEREPSPAEESKPRQQAEEAPTAVPGLIKGGDDLAARARKMKRKKRKGER